MKVPGSRPRRIPLVSACPRCRHPWAQWYTPAALQRLLNGGQPLEAHCGPCDEYWRLSVRQRANLAASLRSYT